MVIDDTVIHTYTMRSFVFSVFVLLLTTAATTTVAAAAVVLTEEQIAAFERDGYLVAKGLLDITTVNDLAAAVAAEEAKSSSKQPGYFSVVQSGVIFLEENATAFRQAALYSQLPQAVAQLMKLNEKQENLRVLRYVGFDIAALCFILNIHSLTYVPLLDLL
jgi:hypothetical protein